LIDKLISNIKKVFIKAPLRVQQFKQKASSLPLPPHPVLSRWGTWHDAVLYYCENYTTIEDIFEGFDSSESSSIRVVKELFSHGFSENLAYIKSNFGAISYTITHLETVGKQLCSSLELVWGTKCQIGKTHGKVADRVKSKLKNVLFQNNGYSALCKISEILSGNEAQLEDDKLALNSNDLTFKYAPVTSCVVKRNFSCYKTILSDSRKSFTFESLKMHVFIQCNPVNNGN
jgi:hypothetical protein